MSNRVTYKFAFTWRGTWAVGTRYAKDDLVKYQGHVWKAVIANVGQTPSEGTYWTLFVSKGDSGAVGTAHLYDIRDYGALTTASDNGSAINAAISAANAAGGGMVFIPCGTWNVTTQITLLDKVQIVGDGTGSHLSFASAGAIANCIQAAGSLAATSVAFSGAITKGDLTITFPSAPAGVAAGTLLLISDTADSTWNAARTNYRAGEYVRVKSVSGGTVTLEAPVYDSYATGGTRGVYVMTPVTVSVRNLRCTFKASVNGLRILHGYRCTVDDVTATGSDQSNILIDKSLETHLARVNVSDTSAAIGLNYGVTISNSQRATVTDCFLMTTRHGLTAGGDDGVTVGASNTVASVPNRELLITGGVIGGHVGNLGGCEIHGNCEYVAFRGVFAPSAIILGGDQITLRDCDIRSTTTANSRYGVLLAEMLGPNVLIQGNRVQATASTTGTNDALVHVGRNTAPWTNCTRSGTLQIIDNDIDWQSYDGRAIDVRNNDCLAATATLDLVVAGNRIHGTGLATNRLAVVVQGDETHGWRSVTIERNDVVGGAIYTDSTGANVITIRDNRVFRSGKQGITVLANATYHTTYQTENEEIIVQGNVIERPAACGMQLAGSGGGSLSTIYVRDNHSVSACANGVSTGSSVTDSSMYLVTAANAFVERNVFGKLPGDVTSTQLRTYAYLTVTNLFESGNRIVGTLLSPLSSITSVTNRYMDTFFPFSFLGAPTAATIYTNVITRRCVIPATAPSSYAKAGTAATASTTFDIAVNGVAKGTFVWAIAGTVATFTFASDVVLAPGDILTITTENPADATLANIGGALAAYSY